MLVSRLINSIGKSLIFLAAISLLASSGCKSLPKTSALKTSPEVDMEEVAGILSSHFKRTIEIESSKQLSKPNRRDQTWRLYLKNPPDASATVILQKSALPEGGDFEVGGFASYFAGLKFLSSIPNSTEFAPAFYGGSVSKRFVLLEDLGETHQSLVDSLTGGSEKRAEDTLRRFMTSLGRLHASTYAHSERYWQIYKEIDPNARS